MILLLIFSSSFGYLWILNLNTDLIIPFTAFKMPLGILYIPFVIFIYAATTNAVNLTDGLDGLAYISIYFSFNFLCSCMLYDERILSSIFSVSINRWTY